MSQKEKLFSRREILLMAGGLSGLVITGTLGSVFQQETQRHLTPHVEMGPFYPRMKPLDTDADLTVFAGKTGRAQGKVVHLSGRVLNHRGEPVSGAKIEIWQANTHGRYANVSDPNPAPLDPNFQGYGVQMTDNEGRYRFKTIKPGAYPTGPNTMRPPHIHFEISGKANQLTTQMFFPGEPLNEKDFLFQELGKERDAALAKLLAPTKELEPDSIVAVFDIVLERG